MSAAPAVVGESPTAPDAPVVQDHAVLNGADAPVPTPSPAQMPTAGVPAIALPTLPMDKPARAAAPARDDDDIVVTARQHVPPPREDPLQALNMQSYAVVQVADKIVVAPAAKTYSRILPAFLRKAVRHFFFNLNEPITFLNYLAQHKVGKAVETAGRFGVNSTLGVAGVMDVAKKRPFNLPPRRNGFANTMGFYGVKPGPFLFLPLVGPTTVRDLIGITLDKLVLPGLVGKPFDKVWFTLPATIITNLDYREQFDAQLRKFRESPNPYAASRASYLQTRQAEIDALHVHKPRKTSPVPKTEPHPIP